jgi:hypothetical protein
MYRYFLYISQPKLSMLHAQISGKSRRKIATEAKFDAKLISLTRRVEREEDPVPFSQIQEVIDFVHTYSDVGSPEHPGSWIQGALTVQHSVTESENMAAWTWCHDFHALIMCGSAHHLLGGLPDAVGPPSSNAWKIVSVIRDQFRDDDVKDSRSQSARVSAGDDNSNLVLKSAAHFANEQQYWAVHQRDLEGLKGKSFVVTQTVDFLAKRLLYGDITSEGNRQSVTVASPLYIALTD